ncbi:MAG: hypothetical protein QOG52_1744 [Frankiaceae bacterium]|jgi:hypothetical protein|nr:hypothetical protein [Frankiaceae bacterium]MDQ1724716.1 hypothetical protein [Frankiaceae bacterium]
MRTVGIITTFVVGLLAAAGLVVGARSLPDIKRYLRMRSM